MCEREGGRDCTRVHTSTCVPVCGAHGETGRGQFKVHTLLPPCSSLSRSRHENEDPPPPAAGSEPGTGRVGAQAGPPRPSWSRVPESRMPSQAARPERWTPARCRPAPGGGSHAAPPWASGGLSAAPGCPPRPSRIPRTEEGKTTHPRKASHGADCPLFLERAPHAPAGVGPSAARFPPRPALTPAGALCVRLSSKSGGAEPH